MKKINIFTAMTLLLIACIILFFHFNKEDKLEESVHIFDDSIPNKAIKDSSVHKKGQINKNTDLSPSSLDERACIKISELVKEPDIEFLENFLMENRLAPHSVDSYLTLLSEDELSLEIKAGNPDALYVMGANKHWSSFRTGDKNPALNNTVAPGQDKKLNKETLEEARYYLWEAALNGMPIALIELSSTYNTEIKRSRLTNEKENELLSNQYLYRKLFDSVAPSISEFFYGTKPEFDKDFSSLDFKSLETRLFEMQKRWSEERGALGKADKFDLIIPSSVSDVYNKDLNVCD